MDDASALAAAKPNENIKTEIKSGNKMFISYDIIFSECY